MVKLPAAAMQKFLDDFHYPSIPVWLLITSRFMSNHNVHKSLCGLCFWAPDPLIGPGANEQSPNELLWTLPFDENVQF